MSAITMFFHNNMDAFQEHVEELVENVSAWWEYDAKDDWDLIKTTWGQRFKHVAESGAYLFDSIIIGNLDYGSIAFKKSLSISLPVGLICGLAHGVVQTLPYLSLYTTITHIFLSSCAGAALGVAALSVPAFLTVGTAVGLAQGLKGIYDNEHHGYFEQISF